LETGTPAVEGPPLEAAPGGEGDGAEERVPLPELIAALSDPAAFEVEGSVEVIQTHASVVFLAGPHAWKIKKPVRLWGLLDYGSFEARRIACEEEVRLNRRLAPEIYLGVVPIVRRRGRLRAGGSGKVVEHAVQMVRIPTGSSLDDRIESGTPVQEEELARVAETLAEFHAANRLAEADARLARPSAFGRVLVQNVRTTGKAVPDPFPPALHDALRRNLARKLAAARGTIRARVARGLMVDGHGDVRCEHVLRYKGRVSIIDCVEFSPRLRHIDPLSDMAFLSMDLAFHGQADLAHAFERAYMEKSDDSDAAELLPLYRAYRAHVRAKVDLQTWRDDGIPQEVRDQKLLDAKAHLVLAWSYAREGRMPVLAILHGPSGSGKTVLARTIAPWLRAEVVQSDVVRKAIAGLEPDDRPTGEDRERLYSPEMSARTYEALRRRAEVGLRAGRAVLLDATYLRAEERSRVAELARSLDAPFAIVDVRCSEETVRERLEVRAGEGKDASDADVDVYRSQVASAEPLSDDEVRATVVHQAGDDAETLALRLADLLQRRAPRAR
jgi:aminoglycoside phosphotransferase family enzyme/predicted kinase